MTSVQANDGVAFTVRGDVVLALWQGPARISRGLWLFKGIERETAGLGDYTIVQFILPSSTPPDKPMREAAMQWLERHRAEVRRFVTVPLGDALWMSIVRTIMRALFIVQRIASTHNVASTIRDGLRRAIADGTAHTPPLDVLAAAIGPLFASLGEDSRRFADGDRAATSG